jgi:hypothetical protein
MQFDFAARSLLGRVDHAGIERPRVNVQAYRPLVELARVHDPVHGLDRVDCARMAGIHLDSIRRRQLAFAFFDILKHDFVVLNEEAPDRHGHPAVLVAMIVD